MKRRLRVVIATAMLVSVSASLVGACGSASSPSSPSDGTTGTPITGSERIGWIQPAASLAHASSYSYKLYVDGNTRVSLGSPSCGATSTTYECSAALPQLSSGRHLLELVAVDAGGVEGPRSETLVVVVTAA